MLNDSLEAWIAHQREISKKRLKQSISATNLTHIRAAFSQIMIPKRGSLLASPVSADWNPEPDYFYHWVRDAAIAMNTVIDIATESATREERDAWVSIFQDYVTFSLDTIKPKQSVYKNPLRKITREELWQYLRTDAELKEMDEDTLMKEPRFNPDGTIDLQNWARPQLDGSALRALTCIRFFRYNPDKIGGIDSLIEKDLAFTLRHADEPCIGPWEEDHQIDQHYFTSLCQLGAIHHGNFVAGSCNETIALLKTGLNAHWDPKAGYYKSLRHLPSTFDSAQFMAALHADLPNGVHSIEDDRLHKTVDALENHFKNSYPINQDEAIPFIGRNPEDKYFGNNPWFPTCFSLAEYYYKRSPEYFEKGDEILSSLRKYIPEDGSLSEQFDRSNGNPVSARHLTWSYAAFLSATHARRLAIDSIRAPSNF